MNSIFRFKVAPTTSDILVQLVAPKRNLTGLCHSRITNQEACLSRTSYRPAEKLTLGISQPKKCNLLRPFTTSFISVYSLLL